ncbi:hypothetical protein COLO4_04445 [Corchorus olitorius]|uniref:Uncharacterized protein n=1 Tax=Corchorus olitorius TaxID=93759 RepID=A0A1R3KTY8_9ROSI|nr:hypothetical protein COLO4_04445 [Corchorus olitorius]
MALVVNAVVKAIKLDANTRKLPVEYEGLNLICFKCGRSVHKGFCPYFPQDDDAGETIAPFSRHGGVLPKKELKAVSASFITADVSKDECDEIPFVQKLWSDYLTDKPKLVVGLDAEVGTSFSFSRIPVV